MLSGLNTESFSPSFDSLPVDPYIKGTFRRRRFSRFTGTPAHVAGMMAEIMEEVGGDGFLFFNAAFDRRYVMEVCDGLVPELQRRGVTRRAYAHKHFRDNLMEF